MVWALCVLAAGPRRPMPVSNVTAPVPPTASGGGEQRRYMLGNVMRHLQVLRISYLEGWPGGRLE